MTFKDLVSGDSVFVDTNIFVYAYAPDPILGSACIDLLTRIRHQDIAGYSAVDVICDAAHRLLTLEACATFGWPYSGIGRRLKRDPSAIQQLPNFQQAVDDILTLNLSILSLRANHLSLIAAASRQHGLLINDASLIILMQECGLTHLASHDADFDRVPGLRRYSPA